MSAAVAKLVGPRGGLPDVVDALCEANRHPLHDERSRRTLPSPSVLDGVMTELRAALFPWHFGAPDLSSEGLAPYVERTLDSALRKLERQVQLGLLFTCSHARHSSAPCRACMAHGAEVTHELATRLPALRAQLGGDAMAAFQGDPAAGSADEAMFCYPGLTAIYHHRVAHELFARHVPLIPRLISELAHAKTGIDIHPGANIGERFFIDHGTGVVIGETCVIGERVRLYQGVTLGAKKFPRDENGEYIKNAPRHPIVEDDVVIYAGATVLGRVTIGRGATIGGNVWITENVAPGARVTQAQNQRRSFGNGAGI